MSLPLTKECLIDFFAECDDLLKKCEQRIEEIGKGTNTISAIQSLYRSIHTLKGSAQLAGYFEIASIAHSIESSLGPANSPINKLGPSHRLYLQKSIHKLKQLADELSEHSKSRKINTAQKISLNKFLEEFHVAVQEMATMLGKSIDFSIVGDDHEIDYQLIRSLKAPIIQILKNSCDHGIECPIERLHKGKQSHGNISILTTTYDGQMTIQVSDDGKGLPHPKIVESVTKNKIDLLNQKEETGIYRLIFEPGFSTAPTITEVSGRGIGMDIVNTEIKKLGGKIEIDSIQDIGFNVIITVPIKHQ